MNLANFLFHKTQQGSPRIYSWEELLNICKDTKKLLTLSKIKKYFLKSIDFIFLILFIKVRTQ